MAAGFIVPLRIFWFLAATTPTAPAAPAVTPPVPSAVAPDMQTAPEESPSSEPTAVRSLPLAERYELLFQGGVGNRDEPPFTIGVPCPGGGAGCAPCAPPTQGLCQTLPHDPVNVVELGARGRWFFRDEEERVRLGLTGALTTNQFRDARASAGGALALQLTTPSAFSDASQRLVFEAEGTAAAGRPHGVTDAVRFGLQLRATYGLFVTQPAPPLLAEFGIFVEARDDTGGERAVVLGLELSYFPAFP